MTHRFLLDSTDIDRRDNTVAKVVKNTVTIHMGPAKTALTVTQAAAPRTQVATGSAVAQRFLQPGGHKAIALWICKNDFGLVNLQ